MEEVSMADHEDKDADAERNLRIAIATLFSELRIAIEALVVGIRTVLNKGEAILVKADLEILATLAQRGAEAIAALDAAMKDLLGRPE
jgi:hypothetical protein